MLGYEFLLDGLPFIKGAMQDAMQIPQPLDRFRLQTAEILNRQVLGPGDRIRNPGRGIIRQEMRARFHLGRLEASPLRLLLERVRVVGSAVIPDGDVVIAVRPVFGAGFVVREKRDAFVVEMVDEEDDEFAVFDHDRHVRGASCDALVVDFVERFFPFFGSSRSSAERGRGNIGLRGTCYSGLLIDSIASFFTVRCEEDRAHREVLVDGSVWFLRVSTLSLLSVSRCLFVSVVLIS